MRCPTRIFFVRLSSTKFSFFFLLVSHTGKVVMSLVYCLIKIQEGHVELEETDSEQILFWYCNVMAGVWIKFLLNIERNYVFNHVNYFVLIAFL